MEAKVLLRSLHESIGLPLSQPVTVVGSEQVPEPYHQLLVHDQHMTVAMENFHQCKVAVKVLKTAKAGSHYTRQILLHPVNEPGKIIQGGLVRIHLDMLDEEVAAAILREDTPLGHILIHHDVLRKIEVLHYVRLDKSPQWQNWPGFQGEKEGYGRLAYIHCDDQPAIELFELIP